MPVMTRSSRLIAPTHYDPHGRYHPGDGLGKLPTVSGSVPFGSRMSRGSNGSLNVLLDVEK